MANAEMNRVYNRLAQVGFQRKFIKDFVLPEWWEDEAAENPTGLAQGLVFVSQRLGLDLTSISDDRVPVSIRQTGPRKFKKSEAVTEEQLAIACAIATQVARIAAPGVRPQSRPVRLAAHEIRNEILASGAPWVSLAALVDYCWQVGIPVIHISQFPKGCKKMHGLAADVDGRPVIVLCKNSKVSGWQLFVLAHELGHIALGHVERGGVLVDEDIDNSGEIDEEEKQANEFAIKLLTGHPKRTYHAAGHWPNATTLASEAIRIGRESRVDPGHVVLNYAHSMGDNFWGVAQAALKQIEPKARAIDLLRSKLAANLDWSKLPEDNSEFLMRMTQEKGQ